MVDSTMFDFDVIKSNTVSFSLESEWMMNKYSKTVQLSYWS